MGVVKDRHGTFYARKKVPKNLEAAVAKITDAGKSRVSWLKASLRTKDLKQANVQAKPVLAKFDAIIAEAAASVADRPLRTSLTQREQERMAAYHYALALRDDELSRTAGFTLPQFNEEKANNAELLHEVRLALAMGDVSAIEDFIGTLLDLSKINLDLACPDYRRLGMLILGQEVEALEAIARRNQGQPVKTPKLEAPATTAPLETGSGTLTAAYKGWQKAQRPSLATLREFGHAVDRFVEMHGDLPVAEIKRRHVLTFREALQDIPPRRAGKLKGADLPALVEWRKGHPNAPRIAAGTVNKLLGGVQAVAIWARDNGVIPDDVVWADPFANMRLEQDDPDREPWTTADLAKLFASPVFADGARPKAGSGEAAYWLPILGMFTGARLGELAPLRVTDVITDAGSGVTFISILESEEDGKRLKTASSRRMIPVHPELVRLGFLTFVATQTIAGGRDALLFPLLKPGANGGLGEKWSKWFGRYIRANGIKSRASVFHSFRHNFKDALRAAKVSEDINDALTGHSGGSVGRKYGAKDMVRRFGAEALQYAVQRVAYPGVTLPRAIDKRAS
jgi:integrase